MEPRAGPRSQRRAWDQVLRPVAERARARGRGRCRSQVTRGDRPSGFPTWCPPPSPSRRTAPAPRRASSASRRSSRRARTPRRPASGRRRSPTRRKVRSAASPLTTLIRSYRLGHAAAWEGITALIAAQAGDPEQRAIATELCSAWLFAYVDAALCLAEDFYSAERERWVRSTAATRAETIDTILAGEPIDAALASRRLGYELDRQHTAVIAWLPGARGGTRHPRRDGSRDRGGPRSPRRHTRRSCIRSASCRSPRGSAPTTRSRPACWTTLRFDTQAAPGVRIAIGEPGHGIARIPPEPQRGRRRPAASPSSPAGRPAPSPATRASALAAMATG